MSTIRYTIAQLTRKEIELAMLSLVTLKRALRNIRAGGSGHVYISSLYPANQAICKNYGICVNFLNMFEYFLMEKYSLTSNRGVSILRHAIGKVSLCFVRETYSLDTINKYQINSSFPICDTSKPIRASEQYMQSQDKYIGRELELRILLLNKWHKEMRLARKLLQGAKNV